MFFRYVHIIRMLFWALGLLQFDRRLTSRALQSDDFMTRAMGGIEKMGTDKTRSTCYE
uniref:Uncharacterized protein n=1 Tax=Candidatus Kentrum sp. DK TaxID=2126562 RepID=A0A450S903_9GAMM|nr:MAG: hypothetical protein BECKDK2373B_GA0170837_102068 [Candidatus Kentron sp. DK]